MYTYCLRTVFLAAVLCAGVSVAETVIAGAAVAGQPRGDGPVRDSSMLRFDGKIYDFGTVREDGGKVTHTFVFRNAGDEPVVILSAASSCGCTVPIYTREPVLPNGRGQVEITFDPMNRAGRFDKEVVLMTSENARPVKLRIAGNVIPRSRSVEEMYPVFVGHGLRLEDNFHAFGYVEHGKTCRTAIGFVNTSDWRLKLRIVVSPASGLLTVDYPSIVEPYAKGEIGLAYSLPASCGKYGTLNDVLTFETEGRPSETSVVVTAVAIDNRDDVIDNYAPKAELTKNIVKFGVVKRRDKTHTGYFTVGNAGEAPLHIRSVEYRSAGLKLSLRGGDTLGAGEKRTVAVEFSPSLCESGYFVERVRIITDDPFRPMRELRVTAVIEE